MQFKKTFPCSYPCFKCARVVIKKLFCCRSILVCAGPPWPCWPHSATNSPACPRPLWRTRPSARDSTPGRNVSRETTVLLNPVGINVPQVCRQDSCQEVHLRQWRHFLEDLLIVIIINNNQLHPVLATVSSFFRKYLKLLILFHSIILRKKF